MCGVIIFQLGFDLADFETKLIFPTKLFFLQVKQKFKYLENEKGFED